MEGEEEDADFFANAAGDAPAPNERVKYEPGGDYFQHMLNKQLRAEKEKQDILDQLEASRQQQAEMVAAFEKQKEEVALEKSRMKAELQAEQMEELAKLKAEMAQMLTLASLSNSAVSAPGQSLTPSSSTYHRIEDKSLHESPGSPPPPSTLKQCSNPDPLQGPSSVGTRQASLGSFPRGPPNSDDLSTSTDEPVEYPRPEDRIEHALPPPASSAEVQPRNSPMTDQIERVLEGEEAAHLDRVDYGSSPEASGQHDLEVDEVG